MTAYKAINGRKVAIVIMKLDELLASISTPSYDPNRMTKKYYSELTKSPAPDGPLFNRAFDGKYEPGAVWKTVIAMTLLEKNSQGKAVTCNGSLKVGNKEIKCMRSHGLVKDMTEAFVVSCNIWFIKNALSELEDKTLRTSFKRFMGSEMKKELGREDNAKDYSKVIGIEGFSETLLKNHFTLYHGYVTSANKVLDTLAQMLKDDKRT